MKKPPIRHRLVIHAGMHKTGSTSLQHALGMRDIPDVHYVRLGKDNHSTALIELYLQNPRQHFTIQRLGLTDTELQDRKKKLEQRLIRQLNNRPEETFVLSGEWLSHAPKPALDALRDAMSPHFTQADVFCYVRAPGGMIPSILQQRIKTGGANFELHWPGYRSQMEQLDRAFGRENVHFRLYDAKAFRGGDIVSDFADWTGIPLRAQPQQTRRNTSLSAAALALIGCYRRNNSVVLDTAQKTQEYNRCIRALRDLGSAPFALSSALIEREVNKHKAELDWVDARLGVVMPRGADAPKDGAVVFQDIEECNRAAAYFSPLLIGEEPGTAPAQGELTDALAWQRIQDFIEQELET